MPKVKICGITNLQDALMSVRAGADTLGFNFYEKSSRFILSEKTAKIVEWLPKDISKVGVFVNDSLEKILEIANMAGLTAIQLHGDESPEFVKRLLAVTGVEIIKVFRVSKDFTPEDVMKYGVDAILLDAYSMKERGGTGETFDWGIAKGLQALIPRLYLAGGLSPANVAEAIQKVRPYAVDVSSGVESSPGKKDPIKVAAFIKAAKEAL
ncbi:MAG: phosphoribosylanthranilate isomerase [Acidobacteriota bacterium]